MPTRFGIAILAAGQASRFGSNKLLYRLSNGQSLLGHTVEQCQHLNNSSLVIIGGAYFQELIDSEVVKGIPLIYNVKWQTGISSSIRLAVEHFEQDDTLTHLFVLPADLARLKKDRLESMLKHSSLNPTSVVASTWKQVISAPAIFPREYWPKLSILEGDRGANKVLKAMSTTSSGKLYLVNHPEAEHDVDTINDLLELELKST